MLAALWLYLGGTALYPARMDTARLAISPQHSATVMASAGTGKTWLLVTRLLRLLLEGATPDSILAITFTRKAAAEMAERLGERLRHLATVDDAARSKALQEIGIAPNPTSLARAAGLYEKYLFAPGQIRVTTFHAFCQELLRRFPLEADVPAGFEILDGSRLLLETAWDALVDDATRQPDGNLARALQQLFDHLGDHQETKKALMRFVHHRSDWWAYTLDQKNPVAYATHKLTAQLAIDLAQDPLLTAWTPERRGELQEYAALLRRHGTATFLAKADILMQALDDSIVEPPKRFATLSRAFLKADGDPLSQKPTKALTKSLGEQGQSRFLSLHEGLTGWIMALRDQYRRRHTWSLSSAWYLAGQSLLTNYQQLKIEHRVLDFSDLEWKAYLLLNRADHALWVQYKLDQRIDHLLIDEFQDTNPTQWHLIFPLLQEISSGIEQRQRSIFLVGDAKQSIYRFRRAEPDLFPAAHRWLQEQLHAVDHTLSVSRRSAPAIIEFVNRIFETGPLREQLPEFGSHRAFHERLWGTVEVFPLIQAEEDEHQDMPVMRNPLQSPRRTMMDRRHRQEGDKIAAQIGTLIKDRMMIGADADARPVSYDDIMILVRNRTHVQAYEEALRAADIPYVTASRGTLLDCIEIRDLVALLEILIVPYNNLTLATVLRSPLFNCSDGDLITLAAYPQGNWLERLLAEVPRQPSGSPLARAARLLPYWQELAGQRPVHDLLDHIYCEGNVVARYEAAFPAHLHSRLRANLTRFIELALEMDSGRYPSLTGFLERLRTLQVLEEDAPDETAENTLAGNVRLLTIHAAKGLESPVVFLADSAAAGPRNRAYQTLVRWPAQALCPSHFLLCGKTSEADSVSAALLDAEAQQQQREQTNLLYVALTRAKQILYISGCLPKNTDMGWYGAIVRQLGDADAIAQNGWHSASGVMPQTIRPGTDANPITMPATDPRLAQPIPSATMDREIAPSHSVEEQTGETRSDELGRQRGLAIHRFLQIMTESPSFDVDRLIRQASAELHLDREKAPVEAWLTEARAVMGNPRYRDWFDPACYDRSYNEVPVYYYSNERLVHGVIDRLVIKDDACVLIDYKTQRNVAQNQLAAAAAPYHEQIRHYVDAARLLWPDKVVRAYLLFTADETGTYEMT